MHSVPRHSVARIYRCVFPPHHDVEASTIGVRSLKFIQRADTSTMTAPYLYGHFQLLRH